MKGKLYPDLAQEAERQLRFGVAAKHWNNAAHATNDHDTAKQYIDNMMRCEMAYTKRLLELNAR